MKSLSLNHAEPGQEMNNYEMTTDKIEILFRAVFVFLIFCALISICFLSIYY
ncbi:hypothetical protein SAMN05444266_11089 [Chitinophaga jiangningensis]|uniref:Uncharacterized protein n=1 Tax=Chitinophaga jiangningensis TaxID=1419482 RepID=A0A1M7L166_9BACT|nr:hypothetical protein SAMN05444266_11089 [Chitinophaga jiangningensis]